jgi:transglutaminase-like putative cysteine protease
MTPQTEPRQTTLDARVDVWPPARTQRYWDYWGTQVFAFDLQVPHSTLTVTATATVDTRPADPPDETVTWADLDTGAVRDRWCEYLLPTGLTTIDEGLTAVGADLRGNAGPADAATAVWEFLDANLTYQPGSTGVSTSAMQAWEQRSGVCQDISHLAIGLLRAAGIPARYVSGYLHPDPSAAVGEPVVGQSHAWVEWWGGAWTPYDPTNRVPVTERHVVVGRGRDYADVPPLKGVYSGPPSSAQGVTVEIVRLR